MKLICETCVIKRALPTGKRVFQKTILAVGKSSDKNQDEAVIMLITNANKAGTKYNVKKNISKIFTRFLAEGKATISFNIPEHDLQIKSEVVQLTSFLKVLKTVLTGAAPNGGSDNTLKLACLSMANKKTSVLSSTKVLATKCVVRSRGDYPLKGFSRNLVTLQISDIKLVRFDPQILLLKNLRSLNLSNNCLEKLPVALGTLRLNEVDISGNSLQNDNWQWLMNPCIQSCLQNLNVSSNNLSYFPINLIYSRVLVRLDLQSNYIAKLPFAIWKMSRLRFLNLANNQLGSVPESMVRMRLDQIDLSENKLTADSCTVPDLRVPVTVGHVPALWEIAARVVVVHKVHYTPGMIPFLLIEIMNRTPICGCGLLCFTSKVYERAKVVRLNCQHLTMNSNHVLYADCVFCSQRCSSRQ
ncbi:leucine-rich repeat protein 1 [Malaya genurostris]|uniref:leucine-rich repeat protein 1 n=1 Tax=Malaya genurostris TaxID=325434 RepID=UPI0026F3801F|nr:leucine-rich repeat protein 1 [Malaya genurostris]